MISNVGELVDNLMGHEGDFEGEVIPEQALVKVLLDDGTIIDLQKLVYEPHPDVPLNGTLWIKGSYA